MGDKINPDHYQRVPGIQCIEVTEHFNNNRGNVIKYVWRAGLKDDELVDLRKAKWYIEREIERVERSREAEEQGEETFHAYEVSDGEDETDWRIYYTDLLQRFFRDTYGPGWQSIWLVFTRFVKRVGRRSEDGIPSR